MLGLSEKFKYLQGVTVFWTLWLHIYHVGRRQNHLQQTCRDTTLAWWKRVSFIGFEHLRHSIIVIINVGFLSEKGGCRARINGELEGMLREL